MYPSTSAMTGYKKIILGLFGVALLAGSTSLAVTPSPATPPAQPSSPAPKTGEGEGEAQEGGAAPGAPGANGNIVYQKGIRFVYQNAGVSSEEEPHIILDRDKYVRLPCIMGLPGKRMPFPKGGKVILTKGKPAFDKATGKLSNLLLSAPLPTGMGDKVLGLLVPVDDEKMSLIFIDESSFKQGEVDLRNFTTETLNLRLGKDKVVVLKPGESKVFIPDNYKPGSYVSTRAMLYRQDPKTSQWVSVRAYQLETQPKGSELNLFVWNSATKCPDRQKVVLLPEYVRKRSK